MSPDVRTLRDQLGERYQRFSGAEQDRHAALLSGLRDMGFDASPMSDGLWRITVCAPDHVGVLSTITGHVAASGLDIRSASIFTVDHQAVPAAMRRPGRAAAPSRAALDIFDVEAPGADPAVWQRFADELKGLLAQVAHGDEGTAREAIMDRFARLPPGGSSDAQLFPVEIEVDNTADAAATVLRIRSADIRGFLFAFSNALTLLNLNIIAAEASTSGKEVHDVFWLTDRRGQKVTSPERIQELRTAATLIKQFTFLLPRAADPAQALRQFHALVGQMTGRPDWVEDFSGLESPQTLRTLADLLGVSRFLWEDFLRMQHENLFPLVSGGGVALEGARSKAELEGGLQKALGGAGTFDQRVEALAAYRDREMFRIDLRHITGRMDFTAFSSELTDLAEVAVEGAARIALEQVRQRSGEPVLADGRPCRWCICALGKSGGREMGFGSDIELLFLYEGDGTSTGPERMETPWYFEEFVRLCLSALATRREGVFELDLRLRPHGKAGPTAVPLALFRQYYAAGGEAQQFERMALVKLRPIVGDATLGSEVLEARDAFVYSGTPLDMENIRHLRHRQATELVPPGAVNAKYSAGGLVDIEYFVQACQVLWGRDDPSLRMSNTTLAIGALSAAGRLDAAFCGRLQQDYGLIRRVIDALRVVRGNAKDLTVPPIDSREFGYLTRRLGLPSPLALSGQLTRIMDANRGLWERYAAAAREPSVR